MADDVIAKILDVIEERPFHRAFLFNELPCPHEKSEDNLSCYSKEGMGHHYKIQKFPFTSGGLVWSGLVWSGLIWFDLIWVEMANIKDPEKDEIRARET